MTSQAENQLLTDPRFLDAITQIAAETPLADVLSEMLLAMERSSSGVYCVFLGLLDGAVEPIAPSLPPAVVDAIRRVAFRVIARLNEAGAIGEELLVMQITDAVNAADVVQAATDLQLRGTWATPIRSTRGDCLGALMVWTRETRMPTPSEARTFGLVRRLAGVAVEHRQLCSQMSHQAMHDPLTGLANRLLLEHELDGAALAALHAQLASALLVVNLDSFRTINEALGHNAGDAVLIEVANRIQRCLPNGAVAGRIAADEFGVVLPLMDSPADATVISQRILEELMPPITVGSRELFVSATVGIATCPQHGRHATALRRNADAALCRAKQDSRGGYLIYKDTLNASVRERVDLAADLRYAMERDQFELHYQPQVLADGTLCGFEALLRWRHPVHGHVSPAKFVPIAEQTGLIPAIGRWVLFTAAEQCRIWQAERPELRMAVNVSAMQLAQEDFVDQVLTIISEAGIAPGSLELELTESLLVNDSEDVTRKLYALRDAGVRIAIDDFGTGYSSLAYLQQLPIDSVKIDRAFIAMIDSHAAAAASRTAIIRAVMTMAGDLDFTVTAEQHRFLQAIGCHHLQGYLFGKPQPATPIAEAVRRIASVA